MTSVGIMASSVNAGTAPAVPFFTEDFDVTSEWSVAPLVRTGRTGIGAALIGANNAQYNIASGNDTAVVGIAFQTASLTGNRLFLQLWDSSQISAAQVFLTAQTDGSLLLNALSNYISAAGVITAGAWHYIELRIRIHDTLGYYSVAVNGTVVLSGTGLDTKTSGSVLDQLRLNGGGTLAATPNRFDDLYIANDSGAFLGPQRLGSVTDVLSENFNALTNWTTVAGSPAIVTGRNGSGVELIGASEAIQYAIASGAQSYFLTLGFAVKFGGLVSATFLSLRGDAGATVHLNLQLGTDGSLQILRNITSLATSAAGVVSAGTWYYLEIQALLHDTAGKVIVRINGTQVVATADDVDTKNAGTATVFDAVRLHSGTGPNPIIDDLRLRTGTLADFLGDVVVP